ncbi:hypothetical protein FOMPIDRAFT_93212 [Fomitopsis schrenkii]|uniref:Uncharacterized protein n=1 Tax=Fomitopsis schrenkii TaxID=2126942 RepID=S8DJ63_FOMSC|nr:hypothetical protein FOMPIDRAFT_93212 [Fomitopsis schrenkii]
MTYGTDPRFQTIDRIIEAANVYLQPNAWQADYLCREAQIIIDLIKSDMTAGEIASYDGMKLHVEHLKTLGSQGRYLDAAKHLWQLIVVGISSLHTCVKSSYVTFPRPRIAVFSDVHHGPRIPRPRLPRLLSKRRRGGLKLDNRLRGTVRRRFM